VTGLLVNPEFVRNVRAQLRLRRMLAAGAVCAALSLAIGYSYAYRRPSDSLAGGARLFETMLWLQVAALSIGGGIACLHAIQREKDRNTFDFQRVTRLSPFELTLGKLFGAPAMAYFVTLCLLPAALIGAVSAGIRPSVLLVAYGILLFGSIVYHALALVISLFLERGSATTAVILYLLVIAASSIPDAASGILTLREVSPFFAYNFVEETIHGPSRFASVSSVASIPHPFSDSFLGLPVHHGLVLALLYLVFFGWFLLALSRNIKRDPSTYQLYTPAQALAVACFLNLILLGFFRWASIGVDAPLKFLILPFDAEAMLLAWNVCVFFILGIALLRNRTLVRRRLHDVDRAVSPAWESLWPAPYVLLGVILVGSVATAAVHWKHNPKFDWSLPVAAFQVTFLAVWLIRDLLYLQWMNLRRGRRPLVMGVLYLIVFYVCAGVLLATLHIDEHPLTAVFVPTPAFNLNRSLWSLHRAGWTLALLAQGLAAVLFSFLQRRQIAELSTTPAEALAAD
jgi:hypothetical protein